MPRKAPPLADIGNMTEIRGSYPADVQHRGPDGRNLHIYGPCRSEASQAEEDLAAMKAVGALFGSDREKGPPKGPKVSHPSALKPKSHVPKRP